MHTVFGYVPGNMRSAFSMKKTLSVVAESDREKENIDDHVLLL